VILSSSDIYSLLARDPILGSLASIKIVEGRPPLEASSGVRIYIQKYPKVSEFEASWDVWIVDYDNEPLDVVLAQVRRLLPRFEIVENKSIVKAKTTELLSAKTEIKQKQQPSISDNVLATVLKKFEELRQSVEDRMLLVGPGRPGKDGKPGIDGKDGRDGRDGRDGVDVVATDARLDDLKDVYVADAKAGNVLTFDGTDWIPKSVNKVFKSGGGAGDGGTMPEPPDDGKYYVRIIGPSGGEWVDLLTAIQSLNLDAGDFDGV
jgi:hypothetical protein